MKKFLLNLLLSALAVFLAAQVLEGISIDGFFTALLVALLLSFFNFFLRPILVFLTLPLTILTFGLFLLVIYVMIIYLTAYLIPGFVVDSFISALLFSFFIWLLQVIFNWLIGEKKAN